MIRQAARPAAGLHAGMMMRVIGGPEIRHRAMRSGQVNHVAGD
jgi:hypothetical protein